MLGLTNSELQLCGSVLLKLGIGVVLAGCVGWEREMHGRPAGVRTHMLLVLGVILFSESSRHFGGDAGRIAAQVVTGVGFLGAGTIMRIGAEVKGLTTAASLWATSGIGMAVSLGGPFLLVAIAAVGLSLITLVWVDRIEERFLVRSKDKILRLTVDTRTDAFGLLEHLSLQHGLKVRSVHVVSTEPNVVVDIEVRGSTEGLLERTLPLHGVQRASWQ